MQRTETWVRYVSYSQQMTCKYRHRHGQRLNGFHIWPYGADGVAVSIVRFNKGFSRPRHLREKGAKLADKLGVFLSLTLCNKANFDPLQHAEYDGLEKNVKQEKNAWIVFFFLI